MNLGDTVTISREEYERLIDRDRWLGYLDDAGVDNWPGIEHAIDSARADGYFDEDEEE